MDVLPNSGRSRPRLGLAARVAIVWVALLLTWVVAAPLRDQWPQPSHPSDVRRLIASMILGGAAVVIVYLACRLLDRRRLADLGLRKPLQALTAGAGLWLGLAAFGGVFGVAVSWFSIAPAPPTWTFAGWLLMQSALVFTSEALPEELAFRGYLYTNLAERLPRWMAVCTQALLFTFWGFALVALQPLLGAGASWSIGLERFLLFLTFAIALALVRLWLGSLWASVGFHWAFQTVMQLLWTDRLSVLRVPAAQLETIAVTLWFFSIVLGSLLVLLAVRFGARWADG